jgi:hypothetical protein
LVPCGSIDILSKGDSGGCGRSSRSLEGVGEDTVGGGSVDTTGRTGSLVSIGEGEVVTVSFRTVGLDAGKAGTVGSSSGIGGVSSVLTLSSSTGIGVTLSLSCTNLVLLVAEGNSTGIGLRSSSVGSSALGGSTSGRSSVTEATEASSDRAISSKPVSTETGVGLEVLGEAGVSLEVLVEF